MKFENFEVFGQKVEKGYFGNFVQKGRFGNFTWKGYFVILQVRAFWSFSIYDVIIRINNEIV